MHLETSSILIVYVFFKTSKNSWVHPLNTIFIHRSKMSIWQLPLLLNFLKMALFERWVGFQFFSFFNWCFISNTISFYFSILKLMFFVQGCQSYFSHFEIIYYQFCSMVNPSGRKINVFAIAQAEQVFISYSLAYVIGQLIHKNKIGHITTSIIITIYQKMLDKIFFKNFFIRLKVHLQNFLLNLRPSSQISFSFFIFVNWNEMAHVFTAFEN